MDHNVLSIATFNTKNRFSFLNTEEDERNLATLLNFLTEEQLDILGTQELTVHKLKTISSKLKQIDYSSIYKGRYGLLGLIPGINTGNETCAVFSRLPLLESKTKRLPIMPNPLLPRILTQGTYQLKKTTEPLVVFNTHLDYQIPELQRKQLDMVFISVAWETLNSSNVVVMGDFNMGLDNADFVHFANRLKDKGLIRVPANNPTHPVNENGAIDHIFVPQGWDIIDIQQDNLQDVSDHQYVKIRAKMH